MAVQWSSWMRNLFGGLWNPDKGPQRSDPSGFGSRAGVVVSDSKALQVAAVFRCIRIIAEVAASLPLRAWRRTGDDDRELLEPDHWLSRLLYEPNETMCGDEWCEAMYAQMAGWGNGYTQVVPNSAGRAVELWPYKVANMQVERREDRSLRYSYPNPAGSLIELPNARVLHLRAFSLDGVMGVSPIGMARDSLGLSVAARDYASSFFATGGRPSGIMTVDKLLTDKQREQIRTEYGGMADGGDNAKRFWLLEGSLKYAAITVNPEDMQMLQTRTFEVAEIARWFGVPLHLLMESEKSSSWGSGLEQVNLSFLTYTLRPYLSRMERTFNRCIIPVAERGKIFVEVDTSPLETADLTALSAFLSNGIQNGYLRRNEARKRLKLPRAEGADALMAQVNMAPLDKLGNLTPSSAQPVSAP